MRQNTWIIDRQLDSRSLFAMIGQWHDKATHSANFFGSCLCCVAPADQCSSLVQLDLLSCWGTGLALSDEVLNATYKLVPGKIPHDDVARLVGVQRTWIKYRDVACKQVPEREGRPGGNSRVDVVSLKIIHTAYERVARYIRRRGDVRFPRPSSNRIFEMES